MRANAAAFAGRTDNPYNEELSLAIGWAGFDPDTDKKFRDTFRRADRGMYADKKRYYEKHDRRKKK